MFFHVFTIVVIVTYFKNKAKGCIINLCSVVERKEDNWVLGNPGSSFNIAFNYN